MRSKKGFKSLKIFKKLFWDYHLKSVLKNLDSPFVIARVLEIGNKEQVKAFISHIGKEKTVNFLTNYGHLFSKQSLNFWRLCFGIREKK